MNITFKLHWYNNYFLEALRKPGIFIFFFCLFNSSISNSRIAVKIIEIFFIDLPYITVLYMYMYINVKVKWASTPQENQNSTCY